MMGYGRTGRLILNLVLLQNGYVPINISSAPEIKKKYNDAIKSWRYEEKMPFLILLQILLKKV